MKGRTNTSEKHSESESRFTSKKKAVLFISFALVAAAFLGAGLLGNDDVGPNAPVGSATTLEPYSLTLVGTSVSTTSSSGWNSFDAGYVYKITLIGAAGGGAARSGIRAAGVPPAVYGGGLTEAVARAGIRAAAAFISASKPCSSNAADLLDTSFIAAPASHDITPDIRNFSNMAFSVIALFSAINQRPVIIPQK